MDDTNDIERLRLEYERRAIDPANEVKYTLFAPDNLFYIQQRQRKVAKLLVRHNVAPLSDKRILEMGSGAGNVLLEYLAFGASPDRIHGIDLLENRLHDAQLLLPKSPLICANGTSIPFKEAAFDLVLQYTAFSSLLDDTIRRQIAHEMLRVLHPDGIIIWYDFWINPTNMHTRGIKPSEIARLFPNCRYEYHRITLAPPITRRLIKISRIVCELLENLRIFNSHYLVAIFPEGSTSR